MGHSISYDEVNVLETALAEKQVQHQLLKSYVPSTVIPSTFVTFVYDNCDHNLETLSGASMHCTYGIIIPKNVRNYIQPQKKAHYFLKERNGSFFLKKRTYYLKK